MCVCVRVSERERKPADDQLKRDESCCLAGAGVRVTLPLRKRALTAPCDARGFILAPGALPSQPRFQLTGVGWTTKGNDKEAFTQSTRHARAVSCLAWGGWKQEVDLGRNHRMHGSSVILSSKNTCHLGAICLSICAPHVYISFSQ